MKYLSLFLIGGFWGDFLGAFADSSTPETIGVQGLITTISVTPSAGDHFPVSAAFPAFILKPPSFFGNRPSQTLDR
jgi:hypothetical protein